MEPMLQQILAGIKAQLLPDKDCPRCGRNASGRAVQDLGCCWECAETERKRLLRQALEGGDTDWLPVHWRNVDATPTSAQAGAYAAAEQWRPAKGWLYIYGSYGVGKSHLAALTARKWADQYSCLWVSFPEFAALSYSGAQGVLRASMGADLLVLDDLLGGSQRSRLLEPLVNSRLLAGQSIIVTTNLYLRRQDKRAGLIEPYELLGQYTAERLLEGVSTYVYMQGANLRVGAHDC